MVRNCASYILIVSLAVLFIESANGMCPQNLETDESVNPEKTKICEKMMEEANRSYNIDGRQKLKKYGDIHYVSLCKKERVSAKCVRPDKFQNLTNFGATNTFSSLNLSNCKILNLAPKVFSNMWRLEYLELDGNNLTQLSPDIFSTPDPECEQQIIIPLRLLKIRHNHIKEIGDFTFKPLIFLQELHLNFNKLTEINQFTFSDLMLQILDLSDNQIEVIHPAAFDTLTVENLKLSRNKLTMLSPGLFQAIKVTNVWLNGNSISALPGGVFNSDLILLHLGNNQITELTDDTLKDLNHLRFLHLDHNEIASIDNNAFAHISSIRILNLSFNKIEKINLYHIMYYNATVSLVEDKTKREAEIEEIVDDDLKPPVTKIKLTDALTPDSYQGYAGYKEVNIRENPIAELLFLGKHTGLDQ